MINTPNVKKTDKKGRYPIRPRREKEEAEEYERYADIITAYRDLLSMTALDEDIRIGWRGRCKVPHERDKLIEWVKVPRNLDLVAEAFRRVCSGYVSTGRLFAISCGPVYTDWPAVISMIQTAEGCLMSACAFMDISGAGKLSEETAKLDEALKTIREVMDSVQWADMMGSLPADHQHKEASKI